MNRSFSRIISLTLSFVTLSIATLSMGSVVARAQQTLESVAAADVDITYMCHSGDSDIFRVVRRVYIDALDRIPTHAEYESFRGKSNLTYDDVRAILLDAKNANDFGRMVRRYHQEILWAADGGNIFTVQYYGQLREDRPLNSSTGAEVTNASIWRVGTRDAVHRKSGKLYEKAGISCLNVRHTKFDAAGHALPMLTGWKKGPCKNVANGCDMDGYVTIRPYWDSSKTVNVCAFDAQGHNKSLAQAENMARTGTCPRYDDAGCGCGPDLKWCIAANGALRSEVSRQITEEPLRIFEYVVTKRKPYTTALTEPYTMATPLLGNYYRYWHRDALPAVTPAYPQLGLRTLINAGNRENNDWEWQKLPAYFAGALTTQEYLTRFGSHRGRVNRLYSGFFCKPFGSAGLPDNPNDVHPNLEKRSGCDGCHKTIEPAGAYWGRFAPGPYVGFQPNSEYPLTKSACATCGTEKNKDCSRECNTFYLTHENTTCRKSDNCKYGTALPNAWRPQNEQNRWNQGPAPLVKQHKAEISGCVAQTMSEKFLHRTPRRAFVASLEREFRTHDEDWLHTLAVMLSSPEYQHETAIVPTSSTH